jgi:hypothetical protein
MIEYRFRVPNAVVFTLYSYSKALEYPLEYSLRVVSGSWPFHMGAVQLRVGERLSSLY